MGCSGSSAAGIPDETKNKNHENKELLDQILIERNSDLNENENYFNKKINVFEDEHKDIIIINDRNDFSNKMLNKINELRQKHGSDDLTNEKVISEKAQNYADLLANSANNYIDNKDFNLENENDFFIHSLNTLQGQPLGEILYRGNDNKNETDPIKIAEYWYEQKNNYPFGKNKSDLKKHDFENSLQFTQIVWKNSKFAGFGISFSKNGEIFVVANFFPPGNIWNNFTDNVQNEE